MAERTGDTPPRRAKGPQTIARGLRADEAKREREIREEEERRAKEVLALTQAENERTDQRVDGFANLAITNLKETNKSQRLQLRIAAVFIAFLIAAILVLAGHAVGIDIPGIGQFTGGGGTVEPDGGGE